MSSGIATEEFDLPAKSRCPAIDRLAGMDVAP
jgi:hypothetical protein